MAQGGLSRADQPVTGTMPAARPPWMKHRSALQAATPLREPPPLESQPPETSAGATPPPLPPRQEASTEDVAGGNGLLTRCGRFIVQTWSRLYLGWGVTVSLLLHLLVLFVLGVTYFHLKDDSGLFLSGVVGKPREIDDLDLPLDTKLDTSFGEKAASLEFLATTAVSDVEAFQSSADTILGALDSGEDAGEGEGIGSMAENIRVPESAVTRGSFTVWTEPEDPKPKTRYDIIIQVKLPPSVKSYRLRDLTGLVRGTDGFTKQIRYKATDRRGVKDGVVQVSVSIPGGAQLVKDTIQIRSQLLDEEQTIEIEF